MAALVLLVAGCAVTSRTGALRHARSGVPVAPSTTTSTTDPGDLPQTDALPPAHTVRFDAAMASLWRGVVDGSLSEAMPAFFPERAYLQVKTVADPAADFEQRLVGEFAADLGAAHDLLGAAGASASLETVTVPEQFAHWVPPGVCANRVGYYEVAHSRLVYREDGVVRSFGIASLISWRGEWYVVHLGAVLRTGTGGALDAPATGPGTSPASSTC